MDANIAELLQKHIDTTMPTWTAMSLQQEAERERRLHFKRIEAEEDKRTAATKQGSWICEFCSQIVEPIFMTSIRPNRQTVRKRAHCDCEEGIALYNKHTEAEQKAESEKYLGYLVQSELWRKFDTSWGSIDGNKQLEAARNLVLKCYSDKSQGLLLSGPVGCGKSHLARAFYKAYGTQGKAVYFIAEPDIVGALGNDHHQGNIVQTAKRADVLIVDDIGAEKFTDNAEWVKNKMQSVYFRIFERRAAKGKMTFITTNLEGVGFKDHVGDRVSSRVMEIVKPNIAKLWDVSDFRVRGL